MCALLFFALAIFDFVPLTVAVSRREMTLIELEYGPNHDQIDDGTLPMEMPVVSRDDPTFAQGYFLTKEADGPDNARCLDGSIGIHLCIHSFMLSV